MRSWSVAVGPVLEQPQTDDLWQAFTEARSKGELKRLIGDVRIAEIC